MASDSFKQGMKRSHRQAFREPAPQAIRREPTSEMESDSDVSGSASENEEMDLAPGLPDAMKDITFGALAEAQDSLNLARQRARPAASEEARADLKARLSQFRGQKLLAKTAEEPTVKHRDVRESAPHRSSKHAPREQSSTYQVTRFRPAVTLSSNPQNVRDPRFSSVSTKANLNEDRVRKNYDFLNTYRDKEAEDMKGVVMSIKMKAKKRKSKQPTQDELDEVEQLKRQINRIENKKKSEQKKATERDVMQRHRKEEREQIKMGKQPFYLKRGEAKKQAERERFESMKGRDRKKLTERREKRKSQKEKRGGAGFGIV